MPDNFSETLINLVAVDSIGSIIIRGLIWLVLVSIIAVGTAQGKKMSQIRNETGLFLLFIVLTGVSIYFVFGIIPTISSRPQSLLLPTTILATLPHLGHFLPKKIAFDFPQILS